VALKQIFVRVGRLSPVNIIPPMFHTHINLNATLIKRTNEQILGTLKKKSSAPSVIEQH
jgi:hypothetical protein